ncbi:relaxase/mobilization nuclease domain-containing protein [Proteocatella sphenisci]|uniref:relaxase/mobilization nuclease domain-containing protein n=1 Tax=Proteocatella sphenisci TaxID=181070 RepID=UPI0004AC67D6|nr:relaxase/mobilization nuclease domain-containing protein [Proteocatella sphenisci]
MGVIKVTKGGKSLIRALEYVEKKSCLSSGKDCSDDRKFAFKEMMNTKDLFDKKDGRQYKHYIQSFAHDEIDPKQAHEIGLIWANKVFEGFEVYVATHDDRHHIHNHFIVNSVNFSNGSKLHLSNKDLDNMKAINDGICIDNDLSVPEKNTKNKEVRSFNQGKYMLFKRIESGEKIKSYVLDTALAVQRALAESKGKTDFIDNLKHQGYKVIWQENRKNVTFIDEDDNKVRLSNLEKTFREPKFRKENIENEFRKFELEGRKSQSSEKRGTRINTGYAENEGYRECSRNYGNKLPEQSGVTVTGGIQQKIRDIQNGVFKTTGDEQGISRRRKKIGREDIER